MSRTRSDEEILELFSDVDEPRFTPQVAAELEISKPAAWKRLADLHDRGLLAKHPARGLHGEAWSLSDEGRAVLHETVIPEEA